MKILTDTTLYKFPYIVQREYLIILTEYSHIKDYNERLCTELGCIHSLNELCLFILDRTLEQQMRRNAYMRIFSEKCAKYPKQRYPTYDFDCQDFSQKRLDDEIKKLSKHQFKIWERT